MSYNSYTKNVPDYYKNRDKKSREGNHSLTTTKTQTLHNGCSKNGARKDFN